MHAYPIYLFAAALAIQLAAFGIHRRRRSLFGRDRVRAAATGLAAALLLILVPFLI